jgi:hypothetical protein
MRKMLAITLAGSLMLAAIPGAALAGDRHSANDVWAGVALGATAAIVGGVLLNVFAAPPIPVSPPAVYTAPPVVYTPPPPVVYAPAPRVVYHAPAVTYKPAPQIVHRYWTPKSQWKHWQREREYGWRDR